MSNYDPDKGPFIVAIPEPKPLNMPLWVPKGTIGALAVHIGIVALSSARDPRGLKVMARPIVSRLPDIAREALMRAYGASAIIEEGESDPVLPDGQQVIRGFGE